MTNSSGYRRDIDGLRAIAVLSVLFYHLDIGWFSGGFVGVDVFFVISGFLITRLIRDQKTAGSFTFGEFYVRRARRLFPALAVTIAGSLVAGAYFFTTVDFARIGGSTIAAILSLSNIYFWQQAGYFDAASVVKPLLHTWSLSVEEQFYLVWPVTLVFLLGRFSQRVTIGFIIVAGLLSLAACQLCLSHFEAVFYLSPFRAGEFAIGAGLVWMIERRLTSKAMLELVLAGGLALIAFSVLSFDETTKFPGVMAMIPCLGAAMAIYAGQAPRLGKVLNNAAMVRIGLVSYSLYLVHWPFIVFYQYAHGGDPLSASDQALIAALALGAAELMYRYVETPFRALKSKSGVQRLSMPAFSLCCAGVAIVLVSISAQIWADGGWKWRLTTKSRNIAAAVAYPPGFADVRLENARFRVLLAGDSHATQHFDMLSQYFMAHGVELNFYRTCLPFASAVVVKDGVPDKTCNRQARGLLEAAQDYDALIVASRWDTYTETTHNPGEARLAKQRFFLWRAETGDEPRSAVHSKAVFSQSLTEFVDAVGKMKIPLLLFGQAPPMGADYSRCATQPRWRHPEKCLPFYTREQAIARIRYSDDAFGAAALRSQRVRRISFVDMLCPEHEIYCRFTMHGEYLYRDDDHVNILGSRLLGFEIQKSLDDFYNLLTANGPKAQMPKAAP